MKAKKAIKRTRPLRASDADWARIKAEARRWAKANGFTGHKAGVSEFVRHAALSFDQAKRKKAISSDSPSIMQDIANGSDDVGQTKIGGSRG